MGFGPFFVCMAAIEGKIEPVVTGMGYELVDVQASSGGRLVRVFIDKPAGSKAGVTLEDCTAVSRQLSRVLEVEGVDYDRLEISSPGLDRPLRKAADFARFAGQRAEVRMRTPDATGRRKFIGVLRGEAGGNVSMELDGQTVQLAIADMDRAKLAPAP